MEKPVTQHSVQIKLTLGIFHNLKELVFVLVLKAPFLLLVFEPPHLNVSFYQIHTHPSPCTPRYSSHLICPPKFWRIFP